jgi:DNA-binding Lrp family transcriptional regulator
VARSDDFPELGPRDARPTTNPAISLTSLRLSPVEGFVLSRVDGTTSYDDISRLTGLGVEPTLEILRKLRRERVILNPGEKPDPPSAPPARSGSARPRSRIGIAAAPPSLLELHDDGSPVDAADLVLGPDLDAELKARIVRLHRRLKALKPHELLGISPGADANLVKRAYFAASKEVHPDRFYGQDIGPYRDLLSDIFAQLTRAFDQCKK